MAHISVKGRFLKITGIPATVPVDYWITVVKKCLACGFGMCTENNKESYFLEIMLPDNSHIKNAVNEVLSACEGVNVKINNKDNIDYSADEHTGWEYQRLTPESLQAARETLKLILCNEYNNTKTIPKTDSNYGHLVREMYLQLESTRFEPVGLYASEGRTPLQSSQKVNNLMVSNSQETEKAPANLRIHKGKELTDNQKMDYKVLATNLRQAAEHLDACAGWAEMSVGRFTQNDEV
ncbi:hypothetical protein KFL82_004675 [Salmonella enterica]|nr:hypothetical protein [Salmonella enterica]EHL6881127.1 hypothetical protein [Salmonella enterica]EHL6896099.1 hypothetical protein [Salmonella enterica]EHL6909909.1 hypothetical protein [Salmonella enterica]EIB2628735.1 hypothetical protein [Salmonella enterica]